MSPAFSLRLLARQSDDKLLELVRQGNQRAFDTLVRRHRRSLLAHARRLLGSTFRAEDALQQALLAAWIALQRGDQVRDGRAWLHRIVHNVSLNMQRRQRHEAAALTEPPPSWCSPDADFERGLRAREALTGLAALPLLQREALLRTAVHGRSREEVANELGISSGAVRGLAYRARAALRGTLTALVPPPVAEWASGARGGFGGGGMSRIAEVAAGGGSMGLTAVVLKSGAAVLTAGAMVAGVTGVAGMAAHSGGAGTGRSHRAAGSTGGVQAFRRIGAAGR
jgi:RNA polymerase sigma factor (sigma-70 family)